MSALAIGKFDALHIGHRALIARAASIGAPVLVTFSGMAEALHWPQRQPLVAPSDRARVLAAWARELGRAVAVIEIPFALVRTMSPREFVAHLVAAHGARALVVGEDFRFGHQRSGGIDELRALGCEAALEVAIVAPVLHQGEAVSSSRVRAALAQGDLAAAEACLGRPHRVVGTVLRGDGRGRTIGVPTANCGARENQEPAPGVYAAWARLDDGAPLAAARHRRWARARR